jgi:hypothetical protein
MEEATMFVRANDRRARYTAFVLLMVSINVIDGMVVRSIADPGRRLVVAGGASFDVVAVVSALYYWMLVRPGIRAPRSLVPIILIGALHATYFYPSVLAIRTITAGLCEVGLIGFVLVQVRRNIRGQRDTDTSSAIRAALAGGWMGPVLANVLTAELSILYYGLFSWRAKPHVTSGARALCIHERVGQADLFAVAPILCVVEILPLHLLLRHWSATVAWIATGLSVYSMIWLTGLARAFHLRPVLAGRDYLHLRYGLLFQLRVPKEMIAVVRPAEATDSKWAVPRRSEPNVCIEFVRAMDAEGLFGIRRRVNAVALTPDDEKGFAQALAELVDNE